MGVCHDADALKAERDEVVVMFMYMHHAKPDVRLIIYCCTYPHLCHPDMEYRRLIKYEPRKSLVRSVAGLGLMLKSFT